MGCLPSCFVMGYTFMYCVCFCLVTCFVCLFHLRKCITGFIPPHILKNTREKFLNFPNRAQRKAYMLHLRTPKCRYPPSSCCVWRTNFPFFGEGIEITICFLLYSFFVTAVGACAQKRICTEKWSVSHLPEGNQATVRCWLWLTSLSSWNSKCPHPSTSIPRWGVRH